MARPARAAVRLRPPRPRHLPAPPARPGLPRGRLRGRGAPRARHRPRGRPPARRGATLTPGTVTDPRLLREDRPTYLVAIAPRGRDGSGWPGPTSRPASSGPASSTSDAAAAELQRLDPAEVIVPRRPAGAPALLVHAQRHAGRAERGRAPTRFRRAFPKADLGDLPLAQIAAGVVVALPRRDPGRRDAAAGDAPAGRAGRRSAPRRRDAAPPGAGGDRARAASGPGACWRRSTARSPRWGGGCCAAGCCAR